MSPHFHAPEYGRWAVRSVLLTFILALAACESPQQRVSQKEDSLAAAGFVVRPANTPQRQSMLTQLPPHHFVQRVHGNTVTYVYADPLVCDCLYVGDQQAYNRFRLHVQQQRLADEQEMTAQMYSNATWDWGGWGPWEPGWEFGPGPGW